AAEQRRKNRAMQPVGIDAAAGEDFWRDGEDRLFRFGRIGPVAAPTCHQVSVAGLADLPLRVLAVETGSLLRWNLVDCERRPQPVGQRETRVVAERRFSLAEMLADMREADPFAAQNTGTAAKLTEESFISADGRRKEIELLASIQSAEESGHVVV